MHRMEQLIIGLPIVLNSKIILQIYHVSWILKKLSFKKCDSLLVTPVKIRNKNCAWVGWWLHGVVPILLASWILSMYNADLHYKFIRWSSCHSVLYQLAQPVSYICTSILDPSKNRVISSWEDIVVKVCFNFFRPLEALFVLIEPFCKNKAAMNLIVILVNY